MATTHPAPWSIKTEPAHGSYPGEVEIVDANGGIVLAGNNDAGEDYHATVDTRAFELIVAAVNAYKAVR